MAMLEQVLAALASDTDTPHDVGDRAAVLISLFQNGVREPAELLRRMKPGR
ncbi:hypothetical protein [Mesorhizobium sp. CAU 1732]|uniref:hypothetical protein n=1 Tax=Mesorhizobium sp. CAU 1732 TaxID=3140358 RepID=UPI0032617013